MLILRQSITIKKTYKKSALKKEPFSSFFCYNETMLRKLQEKFLPRFFEESLFFISVILLTLLCIDPDLRSIFSGDTDEMVMMGMAWFLFIGISVYSVFSKRPLPNVMRYF